MSLDEFFKWRLESVQRYDDSERSLGDIFDVKASIALVAVTFLAGVSAQLITMQGLSPSWEQTQLMAQLAALLLLAVAGALIIAELWPKGYALPATPKENTEWIDKLGKDQTDSTVMDKVLSQHLTSAISRVERNRQVNQKKSVLLQWTFKLLAGAMALVMGNLLLLAFRSAGPAFKLLFHCGQG